MSCRTLVLVALIDGICSCCGGDAGSTTMEAMAGKAVIFEDRGSFGPALAGQLERLGVAARWYPHSMAAQTRVDALGAAEVVFLDALDLDRQQTDPTRSRLASLDLLFRLADAGYTSEPHVVVYSTAMNRPEINIPLRQTPVQCSFFSVDHLTDRLERIVGGDRTGGVAEPTAADWHALHPDLPVGADVARAHQRIQDHERAWQQIWDSDAGFDKAAQVWITRNVLPLLGMESSGGYRVAIDVIRRVSGLPYRL